MVLMGESVFMAELFKRHRGPRQAVCSVSACMKEEEPWIWQIFSHVLGIFMAEHLTQHRRKKKMKKLRRQ